MTIVINEFSIGPLFMCIGLFVLILFEYYILKPFFFILVIVLINRFMMVKIYLASQLKEENILF